MVTPGSQLKGVIIAASVKWLCVCYVWLPTTEVKHINAFTLKEFGGYDDHIECIKLIPKIIPLISDADAINSDEVMSNYWTVINLLIAAIIL